MIDWGWWLWQAAAVALLCVGLGYIVPHYIQLYAQAASEGWYRGKYFVLVTVAKTGHDSQHAVHDNEGSA